MPVSAPKHLQCSESCAIYILQNVNKLALTSMVGHPTHN